MASDLGPITPEGLHRLLGRLTEMGLDPTPGVDGIWTSVCPSCGGVLLIVPERGILQCLGRAAMSLDCLICGAVVEQGKCWGCGG